LRKKKCTDSKRPSAGQQKSRQGEKQPREGLRKSEDEQKQHQRQEQEAEDGGREGAEHTIQLPQPEDMLESVDRLEEDSIPAGLQVVEPAVVSDEGCEDEAED
jgi:hypothetical protein